MLDGIRSKIRDSGFNFPLKVIEGDEVLRAMSHTTAYRVFIGWSLTQGMIGAIVAMLNRDLIVFGFVLAVFGMLPCAIWLIWITRLGLIRAAKEGALSSPESRRMAKIMAISHGVFFSLVMWMLHALWLDPDRSIGWNALWSITGGILNGYIFWVINGRLRRRQGGRQEGDRRAT